MPQLDNPQAAQQALLVACAEDMYDLLPDKTSLTPKEGRCCCAALILGLRTTQPCRKTMAWNLAGDIPEAVLNR